MNIAQSSAIPSPIVAATDPGARPPSGDPAADGSSPQAFGDVLSKSMQAGAPAQPAASTPTTGTPADGKGVKASVTDPTVCGAPEQSLGSDAATLADDIATTTSSKADPNAVSDPTGKATDDAAAALAAATAGTLLAGKGAVQSQDPNAATGSSSAKGDKTKDAPAPDSAASDLAAQIALVSQWAALAQPAATPTVDPKALAKGGSDIRDKLDTIRGASSKGGVPIDASALKDATDASTATAAATALERAKDATLPTTGTAKTAGDIIKDALNATTNGSQHETSMEKLIALAGGNALHAATDATTAATFAQQFALQAASAAGADTTSTATATTAANNPGTLHEQVGTAAWSHEVGQAALRMAANDMQNVSLKMNPEHLGPVDVQMRVDNGVAHIQFAAAHMDTRQALEGSRSTLDQMFSQQGLKVGDWSVGQQSSNGSFARDFASANSGGSGNGSGNGSGGTGRGGDDDGSITVSARTQRALGLVDTFA